MSVNGDNSDLVYQLKRIADALEKMNRKLDVMTIKGPRTEAVRGLRVLDR